MTQHSTVIPAKAGIQYAAAYRLKTKVSGILDRPVKPGDDSGVICANCPYAAGTGSAVTDLIFSIAKREVTFFRGTALISFL